MQCQCNSGYIKETERVSTDDGGELLEVLKRCRLPYQCNLTNSTEFNLLVGAEPEMLKRGSCNDTMLDSEEFCYLLCEGETAAQLQSDILKAIDLTVKCVDGEIVQYPELLTRCSRDAWTGPPLVVLAASTLASLIAASAMERRQAKFESACLHALSVGALHE